MFPIFDTLFSRLHPHLFDEVGRQSNHLLKALLPVVDLVKLHGFVDRKVIDIHRTFGTEDQLPLSQEVNHRRIMILFL